MVEATRIKVLRDEPPRRGGRFVHYWMQQAMRAEGNPALDHAIAVADELGLPVVVSFGLTGARSPAYPDAKARHYAFLLQGLSEVSRTLASRGICFVIRMGAPDEVTLRISEDAAVLVCDRGYLRPQRTWQARVKAEAGCRMIEVETDSVVPIEVASGKHEVGARTLRPKIGRVLDTYLVPPPASPNPRHRADGLQLASDIDLAEPLALLGHLNLDGNVGPVRRFTGGLSAARARLRAFVDGGLDRYKETRGAPERATVSHLSPYLHFGQISPVEIALAVRDQVRAPAEDRDAYVEELVVRRELAHNHCWYDGGYDRYETVPAWARKSLDEHRNDPRPYIYSKDQLAAGETHDRYWNTAMREMRETGYMHNRMRMYWGKKIVEWSPSPEEAFATTLSLNNTYFIDGRDANSFTNVAWLFGLHDRPWFGRPVFGIVRYMGENTFRKFDAEAYVRSVDQLTSAERDGDDEPDSGSGPARKRARAGTKRKLAPEHA